VRKAISIWTFPEELGLADSFRLAKKAGFEGIEVALDEQGELGLDVTEAGARKVVEKAQEAGIEITGLATGLLWRYSLTGDDPAMREKARGIAQKLVLVASWLGVDGTLVIPGASFVSWDPKASAAKYDDAYRRSQEELRAVIPLAEKKKVYLGIENVWNGFLLSPLEMARFIDELESEWVGAYFDVGNVVAFGAPEHWIEILGARIKRVHFKDYRRAAAGLAGFVGLLSGDVDWPAVMSAFKKVGYDGWAVAEMGAYRHYWDQVLYDTSRAMDRIIEGK